MGKSWQAGREIILANALLRAGAGRIGRLSVLWPGGKRFQTSTVNRLEQECLKLDRMDYWQRKLIKGVSHSRTAR